MSIRLSRNASMIACWNSDASPVLQVAPLVTALAILFFVVGCAVPTALPEAHGLSATDDSIVVVGKVVLDPPFSSELEQTTYWNVIGDRSIRDRVMIATGNESRPIQAGRFQGDGWQNYIDAHWGRYFAVRIPRQSLYLNGIAVPLDVRRQEFLWFPGGMVVRPPLDARSIYVGTLRYVRDDFNQVLDIDVIDERDEAHAFFRDRFDADSTQLADALWLRQLPWEGGVAP